MKKELASIELKYVVQELQSILDSRVDQIFQPSTREILITFHKSGEGKKMLRILPNFLFLTQSKGKNPQSPPRFCTLLRKYLGSAFIRSIRQLGCERIVELLFAAKDKEYYLFVELFSKGNVILSDSDKKIIAALDNQQWKDRKIQRDEQYIYPKKQFNVFDYQLEELVGVIKNSKKDNLVKTLAVDIGLGGLYAEEILNILKLKKDRKTFKTAEVNDVHKEIQKLLRKKPKGFIYKQDDKITNITPFTITQYENLQEKTKPSFNQALDSVLSSHIEQEQYLAVQSKYSKKIRKFELIIEAQGAQIEKLKKETQENQKKGEIIYEQYMFFKDILNHLNKAQKSHSWADIKKKLKSHKVIKEVNAKDKTVLVEFS